MPDIVGDFKSAQPTEAPVAKTAKKIGLFAIFLIALAAILGASDFYYLAGYSAKLLGPFAIVAWLILAVLAFFIAMYFAELISMFPTGGGVYEIAKKTYGRFSSFMLGWMMWIVGNYSMALALLAVVEYLLPYSGKVYVIVGAGFGVFWILVLNYMAYRGMDISSVLLSTFGILTFFLCTFTIVPSLINFPELFSSGTLSSFFTIAHFDPFFIHDTGLMRTLGLLMTVYLISELYFGFEAVSFLANDTEHPEKTLPNALIITTGVVTLLLLLYFIASLGVLELEVFANALVPFGLIGKATMGVWGEKIIVLGTALIIIGGAALWPLSGARLLRHMAQDKLFIKGFGELSKKTQTPYKAILFQSVAVTVFFLLLMREFLLGYKDPYEIGHAQYVFLNLIVLIVTIVSVTIWRRRDPERKREFKAPLGTVGPILIALFYIVAFGAWVYMDSFFALTTAKKGLALFFLGLPLYLLVETHYDKYFIIKTNDSLARLTLFFERFMLPKKVISSVMFLLGNIRGKKVLEYGCSVGTLTQHLADSLLPGGTIYATDFSKKRAALTHKRVQERGHYHVRVIHDEEHATRVHPDVPKVDVVVSVSMVGYVQDIENVLVQLNNRLEVGGKICIVENDKFFKFIPNVHWLSKDHFIKEVFEKAGFKVDVTRTEGLLWEYVFIYGEKVRTIQAKTVEVPADLKKEAQDEAAAAALEGEAEQLPDPNDVAVVDQQPSKEALEQPPGETQ